MDSPVISPSQCKNSRTICRFWRPKLRFSTHLCTTSALPTEPSHHLSSNVKHGGFQLLCNSNILSVLIHLVFLLSLLLETINQEFQSKESSMIIANGLVFLIQENREEISFSSLLNVLRKSCRFILFVNNVHSLLLRLEKWIKGIYVANITSLGG